MRKISLENIEQLFTAIADIMTLYIPADTKSCAEYKRWKKGMGLSDALNTTRSPKDFFFPQFEDLVKFKIEGKKIDIIDIRNEHEDFAVFGVKGCDIRAFDILDNVFLYDPIDTYYKNRRDHGVIFSMSCLKPAETCFCNTFGIDAANPDGDIVCHKTDNALYLDAKTEKGTTLLEKLNSVTEECDDIEVSYHKELISTRLSKLPLASLSADAFGSGKTMTYFDSPMWETLSEACIGCGTCTFVCPTCQCYDIRDFNNGREITRYRCWDSCMYSEFTKMSAGQPRPTQKERFRQRFMHKLVYYPEKYNGIYGCVGCGRCVSKCPIHTNIVKVIRELGGNKHD